MLAYVHPVAGALVLALLLYVAALGIRSRGRARNRARLLGRHSQIAPLAFGLVVVAWLAGAFSTLLVRDDLELAGSTHFTLGTALAAVVAAGFWSSRRALAGNENAREIHVWLGVAATLLAAAQALTGLRITP